MSVGAVIGFALAFIVVCWTFSALLAGATVARRSIADPAIGRAVAGLAVMLPPIIGLLVVGALVADSMRQLASGADHCAPHAHHLHLCLEHGAAWASNPVAAPLMAALATLALGRLGHIGLCHARAGRALRILDREAVTRGDVKVVSSGRVFLFTARLVRSRIYMSTAAWASLDPAARAGALAHERAHVRGRDILWRAVLAVAAVLGAPVLARRALARWDLTTERLRDLDAARATGSADDVAAALLALVRRGARSPSWASASLVPPGLEKGEVALRIEALLRGGFPARREHAHRLHGLAGACACIVAAFAVLFADPLHHALETVLGVF